MSNSVSKYVEPFQVEECVQKLDHAFSWKFSDFTKEQIQKSTEEVLYSIGFFLELCNLLNVKGIDKNELILMMKGRILPCIKRFVTKKKWKSMICCDTKCKQKMIKTSICSLLYHLAREPAIAPSIIIENLHQFIFDAACPYNSSAQCSKWFVRLLTSVNSKNELKILENRSIVDARDYQISIDQQLWCFQSIIRSLLQEDYQNIRFLEPLGPQTLALLLQGEAIPCDEVEEHQVILKIQNKIQRKRKTLSHTKSPLQKKPTSIFSFVPGPNANSYELDDPICCMVKNLKIPSSSVYQLALEQTCRMHFAIRTLVSLILHLDKLSVERKKFILDGAVEVLFLISISNCLPKEMIEQNWTTKKSSSKPLLLPNKAWVSSLLSFEFFQQMAHSGVILFHQVGGR
jgi:hypothetical protein